MRILAAKVPNGKLLKLKIKIDDGKISFIQILGDFFSFPEEGIFSLEKNLFGKKREECRSTIDDTIHNEKIKLLGFGAEDLDKLIGDAFS